MTPPEDAAAASQAATTAPPTNGAAVRSGHAAEDPAERRRQFAYLAASIIGYIAFGLVVGMIHYRPHRMSLGDWLAVAVVPTLLFMLLQMWIPWCFVRIRQPLSAQIKEAAVFGTMWVLLMAGLLPHSSGSRALATIANVVQTLTLAVVGAMIARIVREAKILLPLGVIAGLIDVVGAMTPVGFTANTMQSHPEVVSKVSVHVPTVAGLHITTLIGPGDPLFIAFFFAVVHQHRLNTRWTFRLVYILLTLSMLAVQFGFIPAVGALAPMGIAVVVANWRYFKFSRDEKFAMLYAGLICLAGAVGFFMYTNSQVFHHQPGPGMPAQSQPAQPRRAE